MTSYYLGVEWTDSAFRIACYRKVRSSFILVRLDRITFQDSEQSLRIEEFKRWLREHFSADAAFEVSVSVPESRIILKELELPNLPEKELSEALQWDLASKSSVNIPQSLIQYRVIERAGNTVKIASMVMKNHDISEYVSFFRTAGVKLLAIEPSSLSLGRILDIPKSPSVLLTLEGSDENSIFLKNGSPVFSTAISLPMSAQSVKDFRFSKDTAAALISQLKKTITYWETKENTRVESIIVATKAAVFTGFRAMATHAFSIPVHTAVFKKEILTQTKKFSTNQLAEFMVAIGAGDRGRVRADVHAVNFLPANEVAALDKEELIFVIVKNLFRFAFVNVLIICFLLTVFGILKFRAFDIARNITQNARFVANHPAQQYVAEVNRTNTLITQVNALTSGQQDLGARILYIGSALPQKLVLTSLKMANATSQEWAIEGIGDRSEILAFYYNLQATAKAKSVTMPYSNFDKEKGAQFKLTIVW